MKSIKHLLLQSCLFALVTTGGVTIFQNLDQSFSDLTAEKSAVEAAIADYVEGIYEVDSSRIEKSVHPELRKRGYWYNGNEQAYRDDLDMSFSELRHLAATWNVSGKRANEHSPKVIEVYDVNDRTASGKLTAEWGIDYFHLAKYDDGWKIVNVLWQSIPDAN